MVKNFFYGNNEGDLLQIHIGFDKSMYPITKIYPDGSYKNEFLSGTQSKLIWQFQSKWIEIASDGSIYGYPSVDQNYVIAVYKKTNTNFTPPNNAVIYNANGTLHKILQIPQLKSSFLLERIAFNKDKNPPLELSQFEGGLYFNQFGWKKFNEKIVNVMDICYDREYYESQIIDPNTGEFGECLFSWKN